MSKESKYSIRDLRRDFPTEESCLDFVFLSSHSRECPCGGTFSRVAGRRKYQCSRCRHQVSPCAGTMFHKSPTPLSLWFHAIFVFSNAKSGISAKELERQLGVTYKCAYRMLSSIREALAQDDSRLEGEVEVDVGFFGAPVRGPLMHEKPKIAVAISRGGRMRGRVVPTESASVMRDFIERSVDRNAMLYTDGHGSYVKARMGWRHRRIVHSRGYGKGKDHVNTAEGFIAHMKRSMAGTFKSVSRARLQSYLDSFVWHRNHGRDRPRFEALLFASASSRLPA